MIPGCLAQNSSQKLVVTAGMWHHTGITARPGETDKSLFSRCLLELLGPTVNFIRTINSNFLPSPTRFCITYLHVQCFTSPLTTSCQSQAAWPSFSCSNRPRSFLSQVLCTCCLLPFYHWTQLSCPISERFSVIARRQPFHLIILYLSPLFLSQPFENLSSFYLFILITFLLFSSMDRS